MISNCMHKTISKSSIPTKEGHDITIEKKPCHHSSSEEAGFTHVTIMSKDHTRSIRVKG